MATTKYIHLTKSHPLTDGQWVSLDDTQGENAHIEIPELAEVEQEGGEPKQIPQKVEFDVSFLVSGVVHANTKFEFVLMLEDYSQMEGDEPLSYKLDQTVNIFETEEMGTQFWQLRGSAVIIGRVEYSEGVPTNFYRKLEPHIRVDKADVTINEVIGIFKFLSPDEV